MSRYFRRLSFPLLTRELVELAARRRTYVLRVLYALLFFGLFFEFFAGFFARGASHLSPSLLMGHGVIMFWALVTVQFAGVFVFMPELMCGAITREKERDSLVLLLLTDLRPWEVLAQKYLAGLVPMLTFLLLTLPLAAAAYAFGGVSFSEIVRDLTPVLLCCLQVGAVCLMFSAFCRSTVAALVCSWFFEVAWYFVLPGFAEQASSPFWNYFDGRLASLNFNPVLTLPGSFYAWISELRFWFEHPVSWPPFLSIFLTAGFLLLGRLFLVRRALAPPGQLVLRFFRRIDALFKSWNRIAGGLSFGRERSRLPENDPIVWRELAKKPMGSLRYLVRMFVPVELLVVFLGIRFARDQSGTLDNAGFHVLIVALWILSFAAVCIHAANVVVSERGHQTLEVLLTTPLSASEIVRQKARAPLRLAAFCSLPLLTAAGLEIPLRHGWQDYTNSSLSLYVFASIVSVLVYLPMVSWISLWVGLKFRARHRAILASLGLVFGWCAAQFIAQTIVDSHGSHYAEPFVRTVTMLAGPFLLIVLNESPASATYARDDLHMSVWALMIANFAICAALLFTVRHLCLARAEKYLRRS